jgi:lysophospholipase L1-like esterase
VPTPSPDSRRGLIVPAVRWVCWLLPAWPAALLLVAGSARRLFVLVLVWLALAVTRVVASRRRPYGCPKAIYVSHLALCSVPLVLSSVWFFAGPTTKGAAVTMLAATSLLVPVVDTLWSALGDVTTRWTWSDAVVLPAISVAVALLAFEFVAGPVLYPNPFGTDLAAANSPDRSYWYIVRKIDANGVNLATSYGFLGPEPALDYTGLRVVVLGDSIPAASHPVNFPRAAQALFTEQDAGRVEIFNAAFPGYSLEQMKRFYVERLAGLRHDIVVVSFYVDDINRELRYRKENYYYTPGWPEWMQDVYYRCFVCRAVVDASGQTFLDYRARGRHESVPAALRTLDEIRAEAAKRGAVVAMLNVPFFNWPDVLATASDYRYGDINAIVEAWARDRNVRYHDVLPALVGRDIRHLRRAADDIHFNEAGHRLVGAELKRLLDDVIAHERLHDRATARRAASR